MVTVTGNFWRSQPGRVPFNAVVDVKLSDVNTTSGGGAQVKNYTAQGLTFQSDDLIGATIYLLFLDGVNFAQIASDNTLDPAQKEFQFDSETGTVTFSYNIDDPVLETIFYSSAGTALIAPTEPVTVTEFKNYAKIDTGSLEDSIIADMITTAREQIEDYLGVSIIARTVTALLNNSCGGIFLPYCPFISLLSITDCNGDVIDSDSYKLSNKYTPTLLFPQLLEPWDNGITISYTAGYGVPPQKIKSAILQQTFFLYEIRGESPMIYRGAEAAITMSPQAMATLQRLRRVG